MGKADVLETLELAASDQWGIITTAQAHREGITRLQLGRLAEQGTVQRIRRGVYLLPSAQSGASMPIRASWVALNPKLYPDERWASDPAIVVSHESAATLHRIGDLIPAQDTFSAVGRKQTNHEDIRVYTNRNFAEGDIANIDGLPVTSVERTIADLAANKIERNYLATLAVDGLKREGVRFGNVAQALDEHAKHYGASSGKELLQQLQQEASSVDDWQDTLDRFASILASQYVKTPADFFSLPAELQRAIDVQVGKSPLFEAVQNLSLLNQRTELSRLMEEVRANLTNTLHSGYRADTGKRSLKGEE